jgi:hypothetical protein
VYYLAEHDVPTDSADGSYPSFLDEVVMVGAEAYLLYLRANKLIILAQARVAAGAGYLTTGASKINTLNDGGESVGITYQKYGDTEASNGATYEKMAEACINQAKMRHQEFLDILKDKTQMRRETSMSDVRQIKQ